MGAEQVRTNGDLMVSLLRSIDARLKIIADAVLAKKPKEIASDRDLDGQYGDPKVRAMPRDWTGATFKGRHYSECPAELLDLMAEMHEYFATQADNTGKLTQSGKPVAPYERQAAARARGWAKRVREGYVPETQHDSDFGRDSSGFGEDDDQGFGDGFQ